VKCAIRNGLIAASNIRSSSGRSPRLAERLAQSDLLELLHVLRAEHLAAGPGPRQHDEPDLVARLATTQAHPGDRAFVRTEVQYSVERLQGPGVRAAPYDRSVTSRSAFHELSFTQARDLVDDVASRCCSQWAREIRSGTPPTAATIRSLAMDAVAIVYLRMLDLGPRMSRSSGR